MRNESKFERLNTPLNRALSLIVTLAMVLSLMPAQGVAWAVEEYGQAVSAEEESSGTEGSESGDAAESSDAVETADAAPAQDNADAQAAQEPQAIEVVESAEATDPAPADSQASQQEVAATEATTQPAQEAAESADPAPADEQNTQDTYVYEDDSVKVTATVADPASLPKGVELRVTPVTSGSSQYNYGAYMDALNSSSEETYDANNTLLYDVAFLVTKDGKVEEVQPANGSVKVNFEFKNDQLKKELDAPSADDVDVIHLPLKAGVKDASDTTASATTISASDVVVEQLADTDVSGAGSNQLEIQASNFSVFALKYTVDFTYDGFTYSIAGESSTLLSELFQTLGIDKDVAFVRSVEFSDPSLVKVEQTDGNWKLTSLKAFSTEETLTITMASGEAFVVKVTDEQTGFTVTVEVKDYDNSSDYLPTKENFTQNQYYVRVKAHKKDDENTKYYAIKKINPIGSATSTINVAGFQDSTTGLAGQDETLDTIPYSADSMAIDDVRLISNKNYFYNYETANNADDSVQGLRFLPTVTDATGATVHLQRWNGTKLYIDVEGVQSDITENDGYWLHVTVAHQSTGETYYVYNLNTAAVSNGVLSIEANKWYDNNGSIDSSFTGQEVGVTVSLYKAKKSGMTESDAAKHDQNNFAKLEPGQFVNDYKFVSATTNVAPNGLEKYDDADHFSEYKAKLVLRKVSTSNDYDFRSILGPAIGFGITADRFEQQGHDIQSNFAANYYESNAQPVNPNLSGNAAGTIAVANYVNFTTPSSTSGFDVNDNGTVWISDTGNHTVALYTDKSSRLDSQSSSNNVAIIETSPSDVTSGIVKPGLDYMQAVSNELIAHESNIAPIIEANNEITIDASGYPDDATIYVDADSLVDNCFKDGGNNLNLKKKPNQTIVFNFRTSDAVYLKQYNVDLVDPTTGNVTRNNSAPDTSHGSGVNVALNDLTKHVVWNMNKATDIKFNGTAGIFLIPEPTSVAQTVTTASTGWLVTNGYFTNLGGEWHFVYAELSDVDKVTLRANKKIQEDSSTTKRNPTVDEKFEFVFEHYNPIAGEWEQVGETVVNSGANVSCTASALNVGWNLFKISERGKASTTSGNYVKDETVYYAVVQYKAIATDKYVVGSIAYYGASDVNIDQFNVAATSASTFLRAGSTMCDVQFTNSKQSEGTTPETVDVTITKTWKDGGNSSQTRPDWNTFKSKLHLKKNNEVYAGVDPTVSGENTDTWTVTWANLPKRDTGATSDNVYTVVEDAVDKYSAGPDKNVAAGGTITNTLTDTVDVTGTKTWANDGNKSHNNNDEVKLTLKRKSAKNGATEETVNANPSWESNTYTYSNLAKYDDEGYLYTYSVSEAAIEGYKTTQSGNDFTNTFVSGTAQLKAKKALGSGNTWPTNGKVSFNIASSTMQGAQSGPLPKTSTGSEATETTQLTAAGEATFENITYGLADEDKTYYYEITEKATGFDSNWSGSPQKIIAKVEVGKASVSGTLTPTVTYSNDNETSFGTNEANYTITNTYTQQDEVGTITVKKRITPDVAASAANGKKFGITIKKDNKFVNANGELVDANPLLEVAYGADLVINNVPLGTYEITETSQDTLTNYTYTATGSTTTGSVNLSANGDSKDFTLINNYTEDKGKIKITKTVEPAGAATAANGKEFGVTVKKGDMFLNASGQLVSTDPGLKVRAGGELVINDVPLGTYAVTEKSSATVDLWRYVDAGSTTSGEAKVETKDQTATVGLLNKYEAVSGSATLVVNKSVTGDYTGNEDFTFKIEKDSSNEKKTDAITSDTATAKEGGSARFSITYSEPGTYYYTIAEQKGSTNGMYYDTAVRHAKVVVANDLTPTVTYGTSKDGTTETSLTVTNKFGIVGVKAQKVWDDGNNQDGKRPTSVTVRLRANGVEKESATLSGTTWEKEWTNLPKYNQETGAEIQYTVTEDAVSDYTSVVKPDTNDANKFIVTNSYTPGKTEVTVEKVWKDNNNAYETRPQSVTVALKADGAQVGDKITLPYNGEWKYSWTGLDAKKDGKEIAYTVEEDNVSGYSSSVSGDATKGFTITNTLQTVSIEGKKIWDDNDNAAGKRTAVTFQLQKRVGGGTWTNVAGKTASIAADATGDALKYSFTNLPEYEGEKKLEYRVVETNVPEGYTTGGGTNAEGYDITNTIKGKQENELPIDLTVHKTGANNANLAGAVFTLTGPNSTTKHDYTTGTDGNIKITFTQPGSWTLSETKAPAGYTLNNTVYNITVSRDGAPTITYDQGNAIWTWAYNLIFGAPKLDVGNVLNVTDAQTEVTVSKKAVDGSDELAGATIQILKADGTRAKDADGKDLEWTSGTTAKVIKGLETGVEYTLHEEVAPDGYTVASDIKFTIDENGKVTSGNKEVAGGHLVINDALTKIAVSKVDVVGGAEIAGAHIQILDKDGKVVKVNGKDVEWDSVADDASTTDVDEGIHYVEGLKTGETYTLRETVAPDGYAIATDTTFTLKADGSIDTDKTKTTTNTKDGVLLVEDSKIQPTEHTVSVTKEVEQKVAWAGDEAFEFTIRRDEGNDKTTEALPTGSIKIKNGETANFAITFKDPGTYYYQINEVMPAVDKKTTYMYYDTATKYAQVVVTSNAKENKFDAVVTYGTSKESCTESKLTVKNVYATPALEKYINKDVHQDLPAFDTPFVYDILAYVTKDARRVVIHDALQAQDGISFDCAEADVVVTDLGTENDHTAHGTVEKVPYEQRNTLKNMKRLASTRGAKPTISGKNLEIDLPDVANAEMESGDTVNLQGHWVRVTYNVRLDNSKVADMQDYDKNDDTVYDNKTVISSAYPNGSEKDSKKSHDGVATTANYEVYVEGEGGKLVAPEEYKLQANVITVTPPTKTFEVKKVWKAADGKDLAWPEGAKVKVDLLADGKVVTEDLAKDLGITKTSIELSADKTSDTFGELPIYDKYPYSIAESSVTGVDNVFVTTVSGDVNAGFTVTNAKTGIKISKVDVTNGGKELAGAHIQILDQAGNVVEAGGKKLEWVSTNEPQVIAGLETGVTYTLHETIAPEEYLLSTDTTFSLNADGTINSKGTTTTVKDGILIVQDARPALEKYINKDVHQDLPAFDTPFVYDILAYVPKNAKRIVIGDNLVEGVSFNTEAKDVLVQAIGPKNDHTAHGTVEKAEGTTIDTAKVTVDKQNKKLIVEIPDNAGSYVENKDTDSGYWVRVTYNVKLDNSVVSHMKNYEDNDKDVVDNKTVISSQYPNGTQDSPSHDGVKTGAYYDVYLAESAREEDLQKTWSLESNEITVTPPTETVKVAKAWKDADGNAAAWPEGAKATVSLLVNGKEVDDETAKTLNISKKSVELTAANPSDVFGELPIYDAYDYSVAETSVTGVDKGFVATVSGNARDGFVVTNTTTKVSISKVDIAGGAELEGAHIQIRDKDGNVVEEWDSTKEAHVVEGLKPGEKYTLRETVAPLGYAIATDTTFVLNADGTLDKSQSTVAVSDGGTLLVEDAAIAVYVSKVDIADGKEISGAKLQVLDANGKVIDEWTSKEGENHLIKGLVAGQTYTLRETIAPDGYNVTTDIEFTVNADGTITTKGKTTKDANGNTVLLVEDAKKAVKKSAEKTPGKTSGKAATPATSTKTSAFGRSLAKTGDALLGVAVPYLTALGSTLTLVGTLHKRRRRK